MRYIKYFFISVAILILIAFLLKPSLNNFKDFVADVNAKKGTVSFRKTGEFIVYATFEKCYYQWDYVGAYQLVKTEKYIGYLLNFKRIK